MTACKTGLQIVATHKDQRQFSFGNKNTQCLVFKVQSLMVKAQCRSQLAIRAR